MARSHKKNSDFVKDIIIGVSDGLTVPFALTAGVTLIGIVAAAAAYFLAKAVS